MAVNSGSTRTYSLRFVTIRASVSSNRPSTQTVRQCCSRLSSITAENGTDNDKLRKPALSSEVYSTVTFTAPATVSRPSAVFFSRIFNCPTVSTIRAMSGQYSGIAVSMVSSCVVTRFPTTSQHAMSLYFSSMASFLSFCDTTKAYERSRPIIHGCRKWRPESPLKI